MIYRTSYYLQKLKMQQYLPEDELAKLQFKKFKKIVAHAYNTVPYYNTLFKKHKLRPEHIRRPEDIEKIPITSKKDLIANFPNNIISNTVDIDDCTFEQTSGSTGLALNVARSPQANDYALALVMHAMFECGLKFSDKLLTFDDPRHFGKEKTSFLNRFGLLTKHKASVFEDSQTLLSVLQKQKPDAVYGYPSSLFLIAQLMKQKNISLQKKPRFIITSSETLYPVHRKLIEEQFECDIYDHYGSTEFPRIAWQCTQKSDLHINADSLIVEFIKKGQPVERGQGLVTVTSLYNYGMPFLRYSLNDVSEKSACSCKCERTLPLMKSVEGRQDDFIINEKGEALSPKIFCYELDELKGLKEYRLIQSVKGKAILYVVKGNNFRSDELSTAMKNLEKWSNKGLKLRVVFKKSIEQKGAKLRRVVSTVKKPF